MVAVPVEGLTEGELQGDGVVFGVRRGEELVKIVFVGLASENAKRLCRLEESNQGRLGAKIEFRKPRGIIDLLRPSPLTYSSHFHSDHLLAETRRLYPPLR